MILPPSKRQVYTILALPHDWRKTPPNGLTPADVLRFLEKKHLPSNLLLNNNYWPFMSCGWAVQVPTSLANYQPTHLPCQTLLICEFSSNMNHQHALATRAAHARCISGSGSEVAKKKSICLELEGPMLQPYSALSILLLYFCRGGSSQCAA